MTKVFLLCVALGDLAACTHSGGAVLGDTMSYDKGTKKWTPLMEYKSPDIDELTGIDPDEVKAAPTPMTVPTSDAVVPPAATPPPATPTPAPPATTTAKPPAKPTTPAKK